MWNRLINQNQNQIDSYQIQKRRIIPINAPTASIPPDGIDQNLVYTSTPTGGQVIQLPLITPNIIDLDIEIVTFTQEKVTLLGFDTDIVLGANTVQRDGEWRIRATELGWFAVFTPFTERSRIHAYENGNTLSTAISAVNVWTPINCNLILSPGESSFDLSGNTITYTGALDANMEYTQSISGMRGGTGNQLRDIAIAPMVNGNDPTNSISSTAVNRTDNKNVVATGILSLSNGDIIQPGVVNTETDDDVDASEISIILKGW